MICVGDILLSSRGQVGIIIKVIHRRQAQGLPPKRYTIYSVLWPDHKEEYYSYMGGGKLLRNCIKRAKNRIK